MFGDDLLIAPIYRDGLKNNVKLPKGNWRYWFDDQEIIEGPVTLEREFQLEEYPVYIREGAIIPMHIERPYTRIGDKHSSGYLTLRIYPEGKNSFTVHHPDSGNSTSVIVEETESSIKIAFQGLKKPHILHLHLSSDPQKVELDSRLLSNSEDYVFDAEKSKLIIRTDEYSIGEYTIIK